VLAVVGDDLCGSTITGRLLARSPDIELGGELHWLVDLPPGSSATTRAGWTVSRRCVRHGSECRVFAPLESRAIEPERLFDVCVAAVRSESPNLRCLVSTDKYPDHYARFAPSRSLVGVVLFKSPLQAVASQVSHNRRTVDGALAVWRSRYLQILAWADDFFERVVYLEYGAVVDEPSVSVRRLLSTLQLSGLSGCDGEPAGSYHLIGGNPRAVEATHLVMDPKANRLDEEVIRHVRADLVAATVYGELRKRAARSGLHWRAPQSSSEPSSAG
jgi:hypothetical protein